jgi:hypothetical protein
MLCDEGLEVRRCIAALYLDPGASPKSGEKSPHSKAFGRDRNIRVPFCITKATPRRGPAG